MHICAIFKKSVMNKFELLIIILLGMMTMSCSVTADKASQDAACFKIETKGDTAEVISISPLTNIADTFRITSPCNKIVCMSSTYVACLSALGKADAICAVSGAKYISDRKVRNCIQNGEIAEAGYDSAPDYEKIVALSPDVVVTYSLNSAGSAFVTRLRRLGIPVLVLYDYLEQNPLARASYIKVFGALTGMSAKADSIYDCVSERYNVIASSVKASSEIMGNSRMPGDDVRQSGFVKKVLMNIPYSDAWYIPGGENYMSVLVRDAGGEVIGAGPGRSESSIISVEQAYEYSFHADFWLNTGWCDTMEALYSAHPLFSSFKVDNVYNNTLRSGPDGGNDFWESGAVNPDLILHDLVRILHPEIILPEPDTLVYYRKVE